MLKEKVARLLEQELSNSPSLFLIDLKVTPDNSIKIVIDGDEGVTLKDCVAVSRAIERELDREETDFSLEVTSAGATAPIVNPRQYRKNIGRKLSVRTAESKFEGNLSEADDKRIVLEWKSREPKPVGKGKVTVLKSQEIRITEIKEAKVKLNF
ncbi:ribosome assembly cofactor RimP [Lentiprolixibacter aurantiacus]|uniref:Ribosome maturation factor RimP n=1 Tax=Lentiprolixibacter aurantiacus TaxID=2993939 RepID=A0AAE3MJT3_9FLAO|nr:ribosome assembly cofactor RimP [Lentiprolixibacter aurantiacus]